MLIGGHINPAVTFGLFLARKLSLTRAVFYIIMQSLGALAGAGVVKGFQKTQYELLGGGANFVNHGYTKGAGLGAEIVGTFVLVYTVFSATDAKRRARDSHVPVSNFNQLSCKLYLILYTFAASGVLLVVQVLRSKIKIKIVLVNLTYVSIRSLLWLYEISSALKLPIFHGLAATDLLIG